MKRIEVEAKKCPVCGTAFTRESCNQLSDFKEKKYCSRRCFFKANSGENNVNYKRGFKIRKDKYCKVSGDKYLHRQVMERHIGRKLRRGEHVHHLDGNPLNNEISNLQILTHGVHAKIHSDKRMRNEKGQYV